MRTSTSFVALALAAALALAHCGPGNPLVGRWTSTITDGSGFAFVATLNLDANGTASLNYNSTGGTYPTGGTVTCTGAGLTQSGYRWVSTETRLSISGSPVCAGLITCSGTTGAMTNLNCNTLMLGPGGRSILGENNYSLSNGNNSLSILNAGTPTTFSRAP